jgi:dTDP-4-amino-4,6-dideoxygalactose transaminase
MKVPFNDLSRHRDSLRGDIDEAISSVISAMDFIEGSAIECFENNFAEFCGREAFAAAVSNGTSAIHMALLAAGVKSGDEVIIPAHSFIGTAEPILHIGAMPVFTDIDPETHLMDPEKVREQVTSKTKAIIPVHLYGTPVDIAPLKEMIERKPITIIEDAAQAHGAEISGKRTGVLGDIAAFSFYPGKNLGAYGDAGALVSTNKSLIYDCKAMRNHGRYPGKKFDHKILGHNFRANAIQTAILNVKLRHLENWNQKRRDIAKIYKDELEAYVKIPLVPNGATPVFHLFVIETDQRDQLAAFLQSKEVATGIHYPTPLHKHIVIAQLGHSHKVGMPVAERITGQILSLPIFPEMTTGELEYVIHNVKSFYRGKMQ